MTPDLHTACPACPEPVLALYAAAAAFVETPTGDRLELLAAAIASLRPFVEAHFENQEHALSRELAVARHPASPAAVELNRELPFVNALLGRDREDRQ